MTAVADKLREARALIAKGWTQGAFQVNVDGCDRFCMSGAINEVTYDDKEHVAINRLLKLAIDNPRMRRFHKWNDAPDRTQSEVLAAFDKAIALAESGQ